LTEKAPWVVTFGVPPICTLFETAIADVVDLPFNVPWANPENEAKPPAVPVLELKVQVKVMKGGFPEPE
jgi:hypothetical protein